MSRITHWRLYLAARVDTDNSGFLVMTDTEAKRLLDGLSKGMAGTFAVVTGREPNIRTSRTVYVNVSQVVALEPRED